MSRTRTYIRWFRGLEGMTRATWLLVGYLGLLAFLSVLSVIMLVPRYWSFSITQPYELIIDSEPVQEGEACPGEALTYTIEAIVHRSAVVSRIETVWSIDHQETVYPDVEAAFYIWDEGAHIHNERAAIVPRLEPGHYEFKIAITDSAATEPPPTYRIPFQVPTGCPAWGLGP